MSRRGSGLTESVAFGMHRVLSLPLGIPGLSALSELGLLRLVLVWTFLRVGVPFWGFSFSFLFHLSFLWSRIVLILMAFGRRQLFLLLFWLRM